MKSIVLLWLSAGALAQAQNAMPSYRPFLHPLNLHEQWWLTLIPLALFISIGYKAVRVRTFEGFWKQVALMTTQIVLGMILLASGVFLVVEVFMPLFH